jgi:hypothetical protein
LGYWGKPNMDGPEGETHVEFGAKLMSLFDLRFKIYRTRFIYRTYNNRKWNGWKIFLEFPKYHKNSISIIKSTSTKWADFSRYHSRFYAKKDGVNPSRLCIADKLAICLEPSWLYLPRVNWSGEIVEYMKLAESRNLAGENINKYESMKLSTKSQKDWFEAMTSYLQRWVDEHKNGKDDTWTPEIKKAINTSGVWQ